ncbi:MAG: hypothetical protein WCY51_06315 [Sulfurimonas sp.]|uniref:hypothetical protein n=1 Tax=Sulfurimonas sp. TaxID=2022749 RepID=UPI0025CCD0EB|nr:hypothetical protein [Sulfurimonas sp.]MCK9453958.1 hypothetical protein [Sulfurimonas sp.]
MSTLTKQEKDALEDVFLSINTENNKYKKIKELSSFIIADDISSVLSKLLRRAKFGLKKRKNSHFLSLSYKKKKYLSK